MRLEFQLEDKVNEINWWKNLVHPARTEQKIDFQPMFSRTSVGRARQMAEARNKTTEKK